jgi:serine/threonine protein kinase
VTTCGPYELIESVGSGSAGTVYRGRRSGDNEIVAVKVLQGPPPALWVEHLRALTEAPNPHVCRFLELGSQDQQSYIVYQFVEGLDLETARQRYEEGRVPLRTVLRWAIDALKGLGAMHSAGFLHGDIKPSNMMLDGQGRVVVCDFTTLTPLLGPLALDLKNGTPEYLPRDESLLRSPQRDLYALGLSITGLLVGQLPKSPEQAAPTQFDPLLPPAIDHLVARALGLESPFASAQEMRLALESLLTGPEPAAVGSSLSPPTRRVVWQSEHRGRPLWPWLVALLMLPLGVWARSWQAPAPAPAPVSTALWSGVGVAPTAYEQRAVWQVQILGRPVLGFCATDPAAADESAQDRAQWCAAVLEEAYFQKRPLTFAYRRELEDTCEVYLVGKDWPEKFLFRVTPDESKLFGRRAPFLARAWCALLADTAELARPGSRVGERSGGALLLQPWQRRYDTLSGQGQAELDRPDRVGLWLDALDSLDNEARNDLFRAYRDLPEEKADR